MTTIITVNKWQTFFVDNELQYSVGTAKIGNEISRTVFNEQPHFDKTTYHPDNNKVAKRVNNYFVLKGTIKCTWTYDEDDQITSDDIKFLKDILKHDPEHSEAIIIETDTSLSVTYKESYLQKTWLDKSFQYELACNESKLEFLEDDTVVVCFIYNDEIWNEKVINLSPKTEEYLPDQMTVVTKQGSKCYLFFSESCKINVEGNKSAVDKFELVEMENNTATIQNNSNNKCKVIKIYK
jgi:hypothetical protein